MTPLSYSPAFTTVVEVVARALVRWPDDRRMIERAALLLTTGAVAPACPVSYRVRSQLDVSVFYRVTLDGCECPSSRRRRSRDCVHRWACDLLSIAVDRQRVLDGESLTISQEPLPC